MSPTNPPHPQASARGPWLYVIIAAAVTLILGLAIGYFLGRWSLDRQWREPLVQLTPKDVERAAAENSDPVPKAGTSILRPMPLEKTRQVLKPRAAIAPVQAIVGVAGRGDEGAELHLVVENHGQCEVTAVEGVAYGFDAWNRPTKMNVRGEHYVAFSAPLPGAPEPLRLEPSKKTQIGQALRYADVANVLVAEINHVKCADGTDWQRPKG
jgi:hypothetical protein